MATGLAAVAALGVYSTSTSPLRHSASNGSRVAALSYSRSSVAPFG
jgi:hypothetical protein